jgi:hypothetical protein
MTKTNYEYAVIFSEEDVKHDFINCIATAIEDFDDIIILVRNGNYADIRRIAEITYSHERGNGSEWKISVNEKTADLLGIDEIPSELFSIAMMLKNQMSMPMDFSTAFEAAKLITESFRVSHK